MPLSQFVVDAFAAEPFAGNPAAIIVLDAPIGDDLMQALAAENNLSETAFVIPEEVAGKMGWRIRWFTPTVEIDLCGHATLAAAWILAHEYGGLEQAPDKQFEVEFASRSGPLSVAVGSGQATLNFPAQQVSRCDLPDAIAKGLGIASAPCFKAQVTNGNYLVLLESAEQVRDLAPDMSALAAINDGGIIAMAAGDDVDFVSRFFGPFYGIPEDPVTGSAHCSLVTYWSEALGKTNLSARQLSARGGELSCELRGDRVFMSGQAVTVNKTEWRLPHAALSVG